MFEADNFIYKKTAKEAVDALIKIGKVEEIKRPRLHHRQSLLEHPDCYRYDEILLTFLVECDKIH
ncbi:MAG: hypothetical protein Q9M50_00910 [Methylococcales bacterium]|nr:hypothetical protein [Methylococcales bacterium]